MARGRLSVCADPSGSSGLWRPKLSTSDLLFDIEIEGFDGEGTDVGADSGVSAEFRLALAEWTQPEDEFSAKLYEDVRDLKRNFRNGSSSESLRKQIAQELADLKYAVTLRKAVGGQNRVDLFSDLFHSFLTVKPYGGDDLEDEDVIVEVEFRDQFKILAPTLRYQQVLELLPEEFVGTRDRLVDLVRLLSREMASAFSDTGRSIPPWRRPSSIISKWKPKVFTDFPFEPTCSFG